MDLDRILSLCRRWPERVRIYPLGPNVQAMAREKKGLRDAYLQIGVEDELVKNLRGDETRRDLVFLLQIPRDLADLGESRLVLPEDAERELRRPSL